MSNTSKGKASKGSKHQMQRITLPQYKSLIDERLCDTLSWISPCENDDFREYQLNNDYICKRLGIKKDSFNGFWPSRQPLWDGIALGAEGTLYLFEAKSHIKEIVPGKSTQSLENEKKISAAINRIAFKLSGIRITDSQRNIWRKKYYQISNRLVFADKMLSLIDSNTRYKNVVLIFLNFVNDETWRKEGKTVESSSTWKTYYDNIFQEMGIRKNRIKKFNIKIMIFDLSPIN